MIAIYCATTVTMLTCLCLVACKSEPAPSPRQSASTSAHWRAAQFDNLTLTLWPDEFYEDNFFDRLSEYEKEATEAFRRVVGRLQMERYGPSDRLDGALMHERQ